MIKGIQILRHLAIAVLLIAVGAVSALAQVPAPSPSEQKSSPSQPAAPGQAAPLATDNPPAVTHAVSQPAYLTPIAGYQGVLAETIDGSTIAAQAVDEKFNPASSVKLATTLVALQTLGPDHRFITAVWAAGAIDKASGTLTGDLLVTGRDPSLHYEHAVMISRQLNELGIRTVTGNIIVAPNFTINFDWSARHSGEVFRETMDAAKRSATATRAWLDERTLLADNTSLSSVPSVVVNGEVQVGTAPPGALPLLTHKSSRLVDVLKALLCYSNNFMAERIGEGLGGPEAISGLLARELSLNRVVIIVDQRPGDKSRDAAGHDEDSPRVA